MGGEGADLAMLVYVAENRGKECGYVVRERVEVVIIQRWLDLDRSICYLIELS